MKWFLLVAVFFLTDQVTAQKFYMETPEALRWADSVFSKLSDDEKIAQLIVMRESERTANGVKFYAKEVEQSIRKYNIGSICLFQGNPVEQAQYINRFQSIAKTPLMVCIDGEMGLGMRMTDSVKKFPDQLTLGALQDSLIIRKIGKAIGEQCRRMGIQVNYAPVVDVNNNPANPVIGYRSFGENKTKVSNYGIEIMLGIQDENVMATAKHFPGHGDVSVDSHLDLPVITKLRSELDSTELKPFNALFKAGVGSVMIAHLSIPAIDSTANLPTSLSEKNINGLLRNELGYKGISFTDALEMKGVTKYFPNGAASVKSLIAGNDMLCLPGDIGGTIKKIKQAIKKHQLNWVSLNARVKKVLLAKYHLGLEKLQPVEITNLTADLNKKVIPLRTEAAENAMTLLRLSDSSLLPLSHKKHIAYVGVGVDKPNSFSALLQKQYKADVFYFSNTADAQQADNIKVSLQKKYDVVIVGLHNYAKSPLNNFGISANAIALLDYLQKQPNTMAFVFGNPYALKFVCNAPNVIACYEDDSVFQSAATGILNGSVIPKGKLPVTVCDGFESGSGISLSDRFATVQPETVGIKSNSLYEIDSIANDAIRKHATPGCVVLAARNGRLFYYKAYGYMNYDSIEPVQKSTVYDLASVTKISATTVSVMKLYEEGKLDINKTLGDYLPMLQSTDKAPLLIKDVLLHQAGLVAFIPFYKETIDTITGIPKPGFYKKEPDDFFSIRVADSMYMRSDWVDTMYKRMAESKLGASGHYIYSDNDFIYLGKVVEHITGLPLNAYAQRTFYDPLQMASTSFKPRNNEPLAAIAPTEKEKYFRLQQIRGDVHDPGAAMFGGVAGHAGLFSNAYDLSQLYEMLLNGGTWKGIRFFDYKTIKFFTSYHSDSSRRGLGFDKPEKNNAERKDPYPALSASPETFGHTGFTGICVWADPKYNLLFIFLSNRVCPDGGENTKLTDLAVRRNIMEVLYKAMQNKNSM